MSLLVPILAVGGAGVYLANKMQMQNDDVEQKVLDRQRNAPDSNTYASYSDWSQAKAPPDQIERLEPDVDLRGVPFFWAVMKGNGVKVRTYRDPRNSGFGYDV